jgi:branched-chain amino acid transport system ATP-binding protein
VSRRLLSVQQIDSYYGNSHVLQSVSLDVETGQAVALLGRNGAGKTTTLHSILGLVRARSGRIEFAGRDVRTLETHDIARLGIGFVPESRGIFSSLSVLEHLALVKPHGGQKSAWDLDTVFATFPKLHARRNHGGAQLSGGEQQMLAIARALMTAPKLLILDEPTEGLAPTIVAEIGDLLAALKRDGTSILLVEQNFRFAMRLADYVYVLGKGRMRWDGAALALEANGAIKQTWLGI